MFIADEIIKQQLKNVYFVGGTDCESKSRLASGLAEKHGMLLYRNPQGRCGTADTEGFYGFHGFGQSVEAFFGGKSRVLKGFETELQLLILELIKISRDKRVIADIHLPLDAVEDIIDYNRMLLYITAPSELINITLKSNNGGSDTDIKKGSRRNVEKVLNGLTASLISELRQKHWYWIQNEGIAINERVLEYAERHFGLI